MLKDSGCKGRISFKRIENYRIKELIKEGKVEQIGTKQWTQYQLIP
jgi:hypothetical protein